MSRFFFGFFNPADIPDSIIGSVIILCFWPHWQAIFFSIAQKGVIAMVIINSNCLNGIICFIRCFCYDYGNRFTKNRSRMN